MDALEVRNDGEGVMVSGLGDGAGANEIVGDGCILGDGRRGLFTGVSIRGECERINWDSGETATWKD